MTYLIVLLQRDPYIAAWLNCRIAKSWKGESCIFLRFHLKSTIGESKGKPLTVSCSSIGWTVVKCFFYASTCSTPCARFFFVAFRRGDCEITVKCTCIVYFVSRQPSLDFMRVRVAGACQIEMKFPCTSSQSHCDSLILRCSSCIALLLEALLIISFDAAFVAALPFLHCSFRRVKFFF